MMVVVRRYGNYSTGVRHQAATEFISNMTLQYIYCGHGIPAVYTTNQPCGKIRAEGWRNLLCDAFMMLTLRPGWYTQTAVPENRDD
jgi:hypothetical protein